MKVEWYAPADAAYCEASHSGIVAQTGPGFREIALARRPNSGNDGSAISVEIAEKEQRATAENVNKCRYVKPCLQRPPSQSSLLRCRHRPRPCATPTRASSNRSTPIRSTKPLPMRMSDRSTKG